MSSIKEQTKKGLYWSAAGNIANKGIHFTFGIILARLLSPDAYGVLGILGVFICIISVFIDCGFSQALICKQDRKQIDFSTEFFFNIAVGILAYLILFVSAPFISDFYDMPILTPILRVVGIGVIINSLCVVQSAQFAIRLDFSTPAKLSISTQIFSGVIGIILAYKGYGVWALVFQQVVGGFFNCILLWILAGWRPTLEFSRDSFKYLWGYGSKILGASLIQQAYDNLYPLVIGKYFNASQLGLYSRAMGFASLPSTNFSGIVGNVSFPILSKLNNDVPHLINIYRRMIRSTAFVVFPMMLGLSSLASPFVKILLNEQWYGCIIMLQILCIALIWQPLSYIHLSILKVVNRTDVILKLEVYKRSVGLLSLFGAIPFGVTGMCIAFSLWYLYCFVLNTIYTSKCLDLSFWHQIQDVLPILLNSIAMGVIMFTIVYILPNIYMQLISGVLVGLLYYILFSRIFFKSLLQDTVSMFFKNAQ